MEHSKEIERRMKYLVYKVSNESCKRIIIHLVPIASKWFNEETAQELMVQLEREANTSYEEIKELLLMSCMSLRYCEEKYGHDDMTRLNVQAGANLTDEDVEYYRTSGGNNG